MKSKLTLQIFICSECQQLMKAFLAIRVGKARRQIYEAMRRRDGITCRVNERPSSPSGDNESIQYGSPRTTTSCMMMANEYTSPIWVPHFGNPFVVRSASGAVHNNSARETHTYRVEGVTDGGG